ADRRVEGGCPLAAAACELVPENAGPRRMPSPGPCGGSALRRLMPGWKENTPSPSRAPESPHYNRDSPGPMGGHVGAEASASAALLAVRELDAAGRHNDAINTLAAATRQGDLQAMSELGHRLLIGDRAPRLVPHALSFITEAARGGEGRALARVAALTAAGAHMPQDWPKALRLLGEAASAGDRSAQGQLISLQATDGRHASAADSQPAAAGAQENLAQHTSASSSIDWHALAANVRLEYWLSAAPTEALHAKVHRVSDLAPPSVCAWL